MIIWREAAALAAVILLAGCVGQTVVDDTRPAETPVKVTFAATVTGEAIVRWSDGVQTHDGVVDANQTVTVMESQVDPSRYVVAMTLVPIRATDTATCTVTVSLGGNDPAGDTTFTDKTTGYSKAAVCVLGRSKEETQPERAQTVTLTGTSSLGDAQYAATTPNGPAFDDHLAAGVPSKKAFTVVGNINMVVVAREVDDTVTCMIRTGNGYGLMDGDLIDEQHSGGLGAIAACHTDVQQKAKFK